MKVSSSTCNSYDLILTTPETIIMSFPQNWNQNPINPERRDVLKIMRKVLNQCNRPPLLSVYDLAALIVLQCTAVFDRNAIRGSNLQFMDMFQASIEEMVSHQRRVP
jgi:hypothetical protein